MPMLQVELTMRTHPSSARWPHDEKYEKGVVFLSGKYCTWDEALIPLNEFGFVQSDVTYELMTVQRGQFFRLPDHLARFANSCQTFRLRNPYTEQQMVEIFSQLIRLSGFKDAHVFWCLTRGKPKPGGSTMRDRNDPEVWQNRFYAAALPYESFVTPEKRGQGLDVWISKKYIRIPARAVDPRAKNWHWMDMKLSLFEARDRGKDFSVLTDGEDYLTECPGANIFIIKGGQLYTPDSGCLEGITRKSTIELAKMLDIPVHLKKVNVRELEQADEAFITSSAGGIMPIRSVDDILLGRRGEPGELTVRLHNLYWEEIWEGWKCTAVDYGTENAASPEKIEKADLHRSSNCQSRSTEPSSIWSLENLHVWEIANWDLIKRTPEERARLLATFGVKHYAYLRTVDPYGSRLDFNTSHLDVDAEIQAMKRQGIGVRAWQFWLNTDNPTDDPIVVPSLEAFKRHDVRPQIWIPQAMAPCPMSLLAAESKEGFPTSEAEQRERVKREAARIAAFAKLAAPYACQVNLYNHQGWYGMMENQLAILDALKSQGITDVGLAYNLGHSQSGIHDDARNFPPLWERIKPYVVTVNVAVFGDRELGMMQVIQDSGWQGAVGIFSGFGNMEIAIKNALWTMEWASGRMR